MLGRIHIRRRFAGRLTALVLSLFVIFLFASERISFALRDRPRPLAIAFIDAAELRSWIENGRAFQLIDGRPASAYTEAHIAEAVSVGRQSPYDSLSREPVVVYCHRAPVSKLDPCFRAVVVALQDGLHEVYWFKGGMSAWRFAGFAVTNGEG